MLIGKAEDCLGHTYTRYTPCPLCSGISTRIEGSTWMTLLNLFIRLNVHMSTYPTKEEGSSTQEMCGIIRRNSAMKAMHF